MIAASLECYNFATNCVAKDIPMASTEKLLKRYPLFATLHTLHTHNLAESNLIELTDDPQVLIDTLFNHPKLLEKAKNKSQDIPDIIKAIEEIACHHCLTDSLEQMKFHSIKNWLQPPMILGNNMNDFSLTILDDGDLSDNDSMLWDDNLVKACFVLKSIDTTTALHYLYGKSQELHFPIGSKVRYLQCMPVITDFQTIENITYLTRNEYEFRWLVLSSLWLLDCLGQSYSEEAFLQCDKLSLVVGLLKMNHNNVKTLILASQICQGFELVEVDVWIKILTQMVELHLIPELKKSLKWISSYPHLKPLPCVISSWEAIICAPFISADPTRKHLEEKECAAAILLLQCSPLIHMMDLPKLADKCVKAGRHYMAASILPIVQNGQRQSIIDIIISNSPPPTMLKDLESLAEFGILFTDHAVKILKTSI